MIVMPACSTGWFWHCLARETGRIGHLYSPRSQRGPWAWFPYALDNGAFSCWNPAANVFNHEAWAQKETEWREMLFWAQSAPLKPMWAIVPDVPGNKQETLARWGRYAGEVADCGIPLAVAVQDGMMPSDVRRLDPEPTVIAVGGTTEWKWETAEMWAGEFGHTHLLRCNSPTKLELLEQWGYKSTDGTGWNRGDRKQTSGLEAWCRNRAVATQTPLWPYVCREPNKNQLTFA